MGTLDKAIKICDAKPFTYTMYYEVPSGYKDNKVTASLSFKATSPDKIPELKKTFEEYKNKLIKEKKAEFSQEEINKMYAKMDRYVKGSE